MRSKRHLKRRRLERRHPVADIDTFASSLLEEAKRFLEKAPTEGDPAGQVAYLHAALNLAFCSLEAHINAVAEELASHKEFSSAHDQGVLLEKEVRLEDGEFKLKALRIYRLDERILFLHKRVTGKSLDKAVTWWSELAVAMKLRNKLTHPKEAPQITVDSVKRAMQAVIDTIDAVYRGIYGSGLPAAGLGLHSKMTF